MSPIIELQRRQVEVGRIRAGDYGEGHPRKLEKWRLTSKDIQRLEAAAVLWGGEVKAWERGEGFELYTETDVLPIMLIPDTEASLWFESWTAGGCQRRCDGVTEMKTDSPCLCDPAKRECKPHLRFPVLLPDLRGIGSWLVQSTGWNAAKEVPDTVAMLSRASAQGVLLPARLRLEQRKEVVEGKTRRYAVPVVDIDVSLRELLGGQGSPAALPSGYKPVAIEAGNGVSLEQGLAVAETQQLTRTARSAAPIPAADDIPFGTEAVPVPPEPGAPTAEGGVSALTASAPPAPGNSVATSTQDKPLTKAQEKKLNVLVGQLRESGHITTEHLWSALAKSRNFEVDQMIDLLHGRSADEDGNPVLHWSPLRGSLTRAEASSLVDRLERLRETTA